MQRLTDPTERAAAGSWPGTFPDPDQSGLCAWWVDAEGAAALSAGLGEPVTGDIVFVSEGGATSWPSGTTNEATLETRVIGQHLGGTIRQSTIRFSLAASLLDRLALQIIGPKQMTPKSEIDLTDWMIRHLHLSVAPGSPDTLMDLTAQIMSLLDPQLNIRGLAITPVRAALTNRRHAIANFAVEHAIDEVTAAGQRFSPQIRGAINRWREDGMNQVKYLNGASPEGALAYGRDADRSWRRLDYLVSKAYEDRYEPDDEEAWEDMHAITEARSRIPPIPQPTAHPDDWRECARAAFELTGEAVHALEPNSRSVAVQMRIARETYSVYRIAKYHWIEQTIVLSELVASAREALEA